MEIAQTNQVLQQREHRIVLFACMLTQFQDTVFYSSVVGLLHICNNKPIKGILLLI